MLSVRTKCPDRGRLRRVRTTRAAGIASRMTPPAADHFQFLAVFLRFSDSGPELAQPPRRREVAMAQRQVEMLIGRLITDEQFRSDFLDEPEQTLNGLCNCGFDLSTTEVAALVNTDPTLWARTADGIDPRLQKASLKNTTRVPMADNPTERTRS
jgi:hypothetical protein